MLFTNDSHPGIKVNHYVLQVVHSAAFLLKYPSFSHFTNSSWPSSKPSAEVFGTQGHLPCALLFPFTCQCAVTSLGTCGTPGRRWGRGSGRGSDSERLSRRCWKSLGEGQGQGHWDADPMDVDEVLECGDMVGVGSRRRGVAFSLIRPSRNWITGPYKVAF